MVVHRHARRERRLAWAAYVFVLAGTLFGLTVALLRGLRGLDIWIHVVWPAPAAPSSPCSPNPTTTTRQPCSPPPPVLSGASYGS